MSVELDMAALADAIPALNWFYAEITQRTPGGMIYNIVRFTVKKTANGWKWRIAGTVDRAVPERELRAKYPNVRGTTPPPFPGEETLAMIRDLESADAPDFRPDETLPEDYYAL